MLRFKRLPALPSLGLEFWLPLPLLGLAFWLGCGLVTDQLLSQGYKTEGARLQANAQPQVQPARLVLAIRAAISTREGLSRVRVKTANSALKELEFEFPFTELDQVETAIARELGLSLQEVRTLVRYQIVNGN
ncbi:hypothetical protein [Leptolyngbya sp. FACHB-261]|uniref:hypothetical protein n=1 Tax=Leptolyngbya sp. FACHB-261 TaxID=2692806 RepID=UPI001689A54C|nr:hypothetical protein [Leptolyngbya sp. FACHB-261]MBD2100313.1 hypothetical protein [Leptolyngbya sp. FACHB-261]